MEKALEGADHRHSVTLARTPAHGAFASRTRQTRRFLGRSYGAAPDTQPLRVFLPPFIRYTTLVSPRELRMSAFLVSNIAVNAIATCAVRIAAPATRGCAPSALAWILWETNRDSIRVVYGDRADVIFPCLPNLEQVFRYEPVEWPGGRILEALAEYAYNAGATAAFEDGPAHRLVRQVGRWATRACDSAS